MSRKKERLTGRYFNALLYPDDERFSNQIQMLNDYYRWVGIIHDRDIKDDDDGTVKKTHMHVVLRIPSGNATTLRSVVDRLCLDYGNSVHAQVCGNYRASLRYLCHADDLNKVQYSCDDLVGSPEMVKDAVDAIQNNDLNSKVIEVLDRLDDIPVTLSYSEFLRVMCGYGLFSAVRSMPVSEILKEHNEKVLNNA